jgi:flagellar biosynthetic protein FliR
MATIGLEVNAFLAAFARTTSWSLSAPLVGERFIGPRVRAAVAIVIAIAIAPTRTPMSFSALFTALPGEILFGLLAGFSARLVMAGIEAGGQLIGVELGLGFAGTLDPSAGEESLPTRRIAMALASIAFLDAGGLEASIGVLAVAMPASRTFESALRSIAESGSQVFAASLRLAAPVLLASVVANVTTALASRAAPALNVFSVMLAVFLAVGFVVLLASAPHLVGEVTRAAELAAEAPRRMVMP